MQVNSQMYVWSLDYPDYASRLRAMSRLQAWANQRADRLTLVPMEKPLVSEFRQAAGIEWHGTNKRGQQDSGIEWVDAALATVNKL